MAKKQHLLIKDEAGKVLDRYIHKNGQGSFLIQTSSEPEKSYRVERVVPRIGFASSKIKIDHTTFIETCYVTSIKTTEGEVIFKKEEEKKK